MSNFKVDITGINTSQLKSLSHEENIKLFKEYQNGDLLAKEKLINGNLKLVLSILKNFNKKGINMDDLFQVGVIGLIKAIDNFDLSYNLRLSTYGVPLILGEIKKYLRDNSTIRISRSVKEAAYQILKYKEEYINEYGTEPTYGEIANKFNISEYEVGYILEALRPVASIYDPIYSDDGDTLYIEDQIADTKNNLYDNDMILSMNKALEKIPEREHDILIERYVVGKTQAEIATSYDISQAQVSRIEKSALQRVRKLVR